MKLRIRPSFLKLFALVILAFVLLYLASGSNVCRSSRQRAQESALKYDLAVLRQAIDNYTLDRNQLPQSLNDLIRAQYIRRIPTDPMTRHADWLVEIGDLELSPGILSKGLYDVHSSSRAVGIDGSPYNTW